MGQGRSIKQLKRAKEAISKLGIKGVKAEIVDIPKRRSLTKQESDAIKKLKEELKGMK